MGEYFFRGDPTPAGEHDLYFVTLGDTGWSPAQNLGGNLAIDQIVAFRQGAVIGAVVIGTDGQFWQVTSADGGANWGPWTKLAFGGSGLVELMAASSPLPSKLTVTGPTVFELS